MTHPTTLHHMTLNTGHSRESPRSEVRRDVIEAMRPYLTPGTHTLYPPFSRYRLLVSRAGVYCVATIKNSRAVPLVTFGVAPLDRDAAMLWQQLCSLYLNVTDQPGFRSVDFQPPATDPPPAPWCAAITLFCSAGESGWIADFERCFAWAWIESLPPADDSPTT